MSCKIKMGVTTMKRGLSPWRGGCHLLSYKRSLLLPLLTLLDPSLPPIVAAPPSTLLSEALPKLQFNFIHLVEVVLECLADPFFRCPARPRAWRRRRQTICVTEYEGATGCGALYTIVRSSSERLCQVNDYVDYVHLRRVFIGNVCVGM
jgi:hypothetical protein